MTDRPLPPSAGGMNRRQFLARAGILGAVAALWQVPGLLSARGWADPAYAQEVDLVRDTLNGLVAFVWAGDDEYSLAQGDATDAPGAIAAGTTDAFIEALDNFLPAPDGPIDPLHNDMTVPLSGAIANLLNVVALTVNPAAAGAAFLSPFARLSLAEKAEVFRVLEEDTGAPDADLPQPFTRASGNFDFVAGILPGFVAFLAFSEQQMFDPETKTLTGRPVGWDHTGYQDDRTVPVEGWDELLGYYGGRRSADA
jgi:hypothetical protein